MRCIDRVGRSRRYRSASRRPHSGRPKSAADRPGPDLVPVAGLPSFARRYVL